MRFDAVPSSRDIPTAITELAQFITTDSRLMRSSPYLWDAGTEYPMLHRLGTRVAFDKTEGPFRVVAQPDRRRANRAETVAAFYRIVAQKRPKFAEYSDGYPVWLACAVSTALFLPISTVEQLAQDGAFDPRPFERVMVGCFSAGVVFEQPNQMPRCT